MESEMNSITVFILRVLPTPWQTFPRSIIHQEQ